MASYFAMFLVGLSAISGIIWWIDAKFLAPKRQQALQEAESNVGKPLDDEARDKILQQSAIAETAQSIFPVVLAITIFRSFIYEPFQIPSGSMMPNLLDGDFILVEKFSYGVKDPITRTKFIETSLPSRGDIAVFKYPRDTRIDYIKRIVGLPGDTIVYKNKTLYILPSCDNNPDHCEKYYEVKVEELKDPSYAKYDDDQNRYEATMFDVKHLLLRNDGGRLGLGAYFAQNGVGDGETWIVPKGNYFALGDNRDNSQDSRFWGFVPEENLVGRAVFIWMSFDFERDPNDFLPRWIPTGVRFNRIGSL